MDGLVGLVVKASALRAEDCAEIFRWLSHTSDLKIGTPVATLPGAWCYRVSAGTGWPNDWVRWKVWSTTFNPVWQYVKLSEQIHPWDTLACCWNVKQPTNITRVALPWSAFYPPWNCLLRNGLWGVCWWLYVPATCECISGTDLLRQFYVLPHCRPNFPSHPVTVYWHRANQSQHWHYNSRRLSG